MTQPKTPGEAAREEFRSQNPANAQLDWDAIAAAAIEAARESGGGLGIVDGPYCAGCGLKLLTGVDLSRERDFGREHNDAGVARQPPTPPTASEDEDEREHCIRTMKSIGFTDHMGDVLLDELDWLLRERAAVRAEYEADISRHMRTIHARDRAVAAADRAGYERGRAEMQVRMDLLADATIETIDESLDDDQRNIQLQSELATAGADVATYRSGWLDLQSKLTELQSKHDRLEQTIEAERGMLRDERKRYDRLAAVARHVTQGSTNLEELIRRRGALRNTLADLAALSDDAPQSETKLRNEDESETKPTNEERDE